MTVQTTTSRINYTGNGTSTVFAYNFKIYDQTHLKVYVDGVLKTLTTDYTVSGVGVASGGNVTFLIAPASSKSIVISRVVPITQLVTTVNNDTIFSEVFDSAIDKLTMISQQNEANIARSPQLGSSDIDGSGAYQANGNRITNLGTPTGSTDAVTKAYADAVITTAAASASAAATSATAAAGSASSASTSATSSASSATASANSATASAASATAAAASAAAGLYRQVIDKSANYTILSADQGSLIRGNTGSGAITFTLPQISSVTDGFKIAIVKWTSDANAVNINRAGSDTINGATSVQIGSQYSQIILVADFETNTWFASQSGLGATNMNVDVFSGNASTTAFTLTAAPGASNNAHVYVGGVYQYHSTFTIAGTTLTFSAAPPTGTSNIEVWYGTPLAIGTPSDGTVTDAKLTTSGVTAGTYGSATAVPQITVNDKGRVTTIAEVTVAGVPSGAVMPFAGSSAPSGWLLCYGQAVSRTTYAALFALLSTTYGTGDGSTTFNLPDLRGRAPHGVDNMGGTAANRVTSGGSGITGTTLGAVGGTETHTLTTTQMPSHNHNTFSNGVQWGGTGGCNVGYAGSTNQVSSGGTLTGSTGGGGAHQNMSPSIMLNYIIKT